MRSIIRAVAGAALALTAAIAVPAAALAADTQPMYRLYNPNGGEHFYTASVGERTNLVNLGWKSEGEGWTAPTSSNTPVYRLYNPNGGDHHYTTSSGERDLLVAVGWKSEGVGWYSDDAKGVAIYRQYNPNAKTGSHNYTASLSENNALVAAGWRAEGIGWYGVDSDQTLSMDDYYKQIERQAKGPVVYTCTGDYDGDGANESFVVTGIGGNNLIWSKAELWFVSSSGIVSKVAGEEMFPLMRMYSECEPSFSYVDDSELSPTYCGFFCVDSTYGGPTHISHVYSVRNGKAVEVPFDVEHIGFVHCEESSNQLIGYVSVSLEPRKWQKYGFDFDPDAFAFKTTGTIGDPTNEFIL